MKTIFKYTALANLSWLMILLMSPMNLLAQQESISIAQYINSQTNTLEIPTPFGASKLNYSSQLKQLKGKQIFHIDLVYTAYRESESFDQELLNQNRMAALKKLIPQIETDQPDWSFFRQTGALERADAKQYFHGFVIHYGSPIDYQRQQTYFSDWQVPFSTTGINNQEGGRARYYTGSQIIMPKEAVTYPNGEQVQGVYQLGYREFRDPAQMTFSGIPMTYTGDGKEEVFNSAGMYEIRAWKDGQELVLVKPAEVYFQCTEVLPDVSFFQLNEEADWEKNHGIQFNTLPGGKDNFGTQLSATQFGNFSITLADLAKKRIGVANYVPQSEIDQNGYQGYSRITETRGVDRHQFKVSMDEPAWNSFAYRYSNDSALVTWVENPDEKEKSVLVFKAQFRQFAERVMGQKLEDTDSLIYDGTTYYKTRLRQDQASLENVLGDEPIPASPGLVAGLKSPSFGVYNCDQTMRIAEPLAVSPTYFDQESGQKLEHLYVACVIDMKLNASLTYHPNHLVCSGSGKSQVLVFDENKNMFLIGQQELSKVDLTKRYVDLKVRNITAEVKNTDDLKKVLGI